eukprot:GFUD01027734.1.p1 GENE.GFUD01027734.1~~GFUD01027734.1.p1  ORF type:complete len:371 (-),score=79.73 GFUD01027734.1:152-1264(-)
MSQTSIDRRTAIRCNGEALRQYIEFEQLQTSFITYRTKVEMAAESLRDIAKELHEIEIKNVKHKKNGYLTSTVGSGVLGTAMIGGLMTANPVVTIGMFAGTVLTSVGSLIVFTGKEKNRIKELEQRVTDMLLGLEEEFERCQRNMAFMNGDGQGIDQIRANLDNALIGRAMAGNAGMSLDTITRIITNIQGFSTNMRSRVNDLPAEVRALLSDGFSQMQYFISPYGATQLINMMRTDVPMAENLPRASVPPSTCCAGSGLDCITAPAPPVNTSNSGSGVVCASNGKRSFYSNCGKFGKVVYTVGAVFAAFEFYNSVTLAGELTKKLQRLRDASDLLKYEGAAKEVFNIALDLQVILTTIFRDGDEEYDVI